MLEYNLQLFAKDGPGGEKTEQPTAKKLDDARKEGQVAKSKEINLGFSLLAMFVLLKIWVGHLGGDFINVFKAVFAKIPDITHISASSGDLSWEIMDIIRQIMLQMLLMIAPFALLALVVGIVCEVVQVKWKPTAKPLQPKFNKLNPLTGFKKFFSLNALIELLKAIVTILMIFYIVYSSVKNLWPNIFYIFDMPVEQTVELLGTEVFNLGIKISMFYLIIAFADLFYQRWKFNDDMKMTKQEVKDEYKNSEGDPQIKGKIRQRMMQASQRRMMQELPKADVVITNPTHFAVALKYDPDKYDAPYVVAKGADHLAAKIKEIAKENHIEIVENKPLARMLYHNVELEEVIPPELYKAVADIIAYVYKVKGKV